MTLRRMAGSAGGSGRSKRRRVSLKVYIVGFAALFVVVAAAGIAYEHSAATRDARNSATQDARYGARFAARDIAAALDARTGRQAVIISVPVPGHGAIVTFLDLGGLGPGLSSSLGGPRNLEFLVTTADNAAAITRSVAPDKWSGTKLAGTAFARPG